MATNRYINLLAMKNSLVVIYRETDRFNNKTKIYVTLLVFHIFTRCPEL